MNGQWLNPYLGKHLSSFHFNYDFAEMASRCDIFKSLSRFVKLEYLVNDRMDPFVSVELQSFFEPIFGSIPDTFQGDISPKRKHVGVYDSYSLSIFTLRYPTQEISPPHLIQAKLLASVSGPPCSKMISTPLSLVIAMTCLCQFGFVL